MRGIKLRPNILAKKKRKEEKEGMAIPQSNRINLS